MAKLGDICQFIYGRGLPASERVPGEYKVFGSNGCVGTHTETISTSPAIIIGRKGSIGQLNYSDKPCWPIDTTYYVDGTSTSENIRWLYYVLTSLRLPELNKATGVPGLNRNDAYEKVLNVPVAEEQSRIANLLDKADGIQRKREKAVELAGGLLNAVFLDLFGNPETNPKGWPTMPLGKLGELDRGKSRHRPRNDPRLLGGPYPLIQTGDVARADRVITKFSSTYSEFGLAQSKLWPKGTLCITIAANIADAATLGMDACFPDSVVGFRPGPHVTADYVQAWLGFLKETISENAPQSAQKNINLRILRELEVPCHPQVCRKRILVWLPRS